MISYNTRLFFSMKLVGSLSMRIRLVMRDEVDEEILKKAVNDTMTRYPYLGKKVVVRDGAYEYADNPLPVPVLKTTCPLPKYGTEETNYHLILVDYEGKNIYFNMCHALSAGRGMARWICSCLYAYVTEKYGVKLNCPGIRDPFSPPLEGEDLIEPFDHLPEMTGSYEDTGSGVSPISPTELDAILPKGEEEGLFNTFIRLDSKAVMERVKANHASPAVYFAVLINRAFTSVLDEIPEGIRYGIACDSSEDIGCGETMSLITRFLSFVVTKKDGELPMEELCTKGKAMIREQMDPSIIVDLIKSEKKVLEEMENLPSPQEKAMYYMTHSDSFKNVPSFLVSYVGRYDMEELNEYVEDIGCSGANYGRGLVIYCYKNSFTLSFFTPTKKDDPTLQAFLDVLKEEGLAYEVESANPQNDVFLEMPD